MDFAGLARVLEWGCRRAEKRLERLLLGGRGKEEEEGENDGGEKVRARAMACRLDASRSAAIAQGLEEDLRSCEAPLFVSAAIRDAKRAAEGALEAAAAAEEALGLETRET